MFTGIISHRAAVVDLATKPEGAQLVLDAAGWSHAPARGDSIAVNGCCLTVVEADRGLLRFDVIHQTLRNTTLGHLRPGTPVNIEHAATPTTLLGGHIVQGHVDGTGSVRRIIREGGEHRIRVEPPTNLMKYIIERGSIAIDGVSLTVASVNESTFEVSLIPTTLDLTTLNALRERDPVNLEADYFTKVVIDWISRHGSPPALRHDPSQQQPANQADLRERR